MSSALTQDQKPVSGIRLPYWLITALAACLIPVITHVLFPMLGIHFVEQRLSATTLPKLIAFALGGLAYWQYVRFCINHPLILALYVGVLIWPVIYLGFALEKVGIILPIRVMHIAVLLVPAIIMLLQNFRYLNRNYIYFKYLILFISAFGLYYAFYNFNFVEPAIASRLTNSISQVKLHDYFYSFVGIVFVACAFKKTNGPEERFKLFRMINWYVIIFTLIHGVLTLMGYPLGLFTAVVEGFTRTTGLTSHPNEFAKLEGLWLIYFIGLYYYYGQLQNKALTKDRLLIGSSVIFNILAFLLSMSKNSFASFGLSCLLFFGLCLFDAKLRQQIILPIVLLATLLLLVLSGYQIYTGTDLLTTLTNRFQDTRSLEWRYTVWGYLLGHMDQHSIWLGHGLTASNIELFRFLFDTSKESKGQSIFVHNAFINFLYDMGILGMLVFSSFLVNGFHALKHYIRSHNALSLALFCLTVFTLVSSCVDECITDNKVSVLFWFLVTLAQSYFIKSPRQTPPSRTGSTHA